MTSLRNRVTQVAIVFGVLLLGGCEAVHLYEGKRQPTDKLALILGDTRLSGSLPLTLIIRKVDDEELGLRYRGAYVLPGEHDLLIDCTITESNQISRHHLHVDVDAGVKYRLVADTGAGNRTCVDVQIVNR